jgi:2-haloacid dehalogenase
MSRMSRMRRVLVFDVNETLLDLAALDPAFEEAFAMPGVRREWFAQLLQSALVATVTDAYADFGTIGSAALEMVAQRHGRRLSARDREAILGTMRTLPPHPDVVPALTRLTAAGLRLAALTNNTGEVVRAQFDHAGLTGFFDPIMSADTVRRPKPAPDAYLMAARRMGVDIGGMRMIAAHAWDIAGAIRAGAAAAFVGRPGMVLDPGVPRPEIVGQDLGDVAEQILALDATG